jgi:hypothetical protein
LPTLNDGEVLLNLIFNYGSGNTDLIWVDTDPSWCSYSYLNTDGDPDNWETEWFCDTPTGDYYIDGSVKQLGGSDNDGNTGAVISAIDDISTITGTPVIIPVEVSYPDLSTMDVGSDVLTDARISTTLADGFPAGAQIFDITYNGTSVLTLDYDLSGKSEVLLSDILRSAPTALLGHSNQTVNWEFYVDGITSSATIPVNVEALAYIDIEDCATVLDVESFDVNFADATLTVTEPVEVCKNDPLQFAVTIEYPVISNLNTAIKADAKITAASALPAGTVIDWVYKGAVSGSHTLLSSTNVILLSTIVNNLPASLQGHSGMDVWSFTISNAGLMTANLVTIEAVAVLDGVNYVHATDQISLTVNALPEVASTTMQYSVDGGVNWAPAGGDLSTAFSLCMDPVTYADGWYHLDINTLAMVNTAVDLEEGVLNPFKLVSDPGTTFDDWWTAKFAEWNDVGMQTAMESILSGAEPMFYIKRVGTDYKLIDGFQYALDESEEILRLDSDYPVGDYTFNGTVTDVNGCVSGAFDVDLNITHNSTYAFSYNEPGSICATTGLTLPVTFGTAIEGGCGYDGVRFKITATGAGDVTMGAEDSNSNYYSFTNSGFWGPESGFDLPAMYTATTNWDMTFSAPGTYNITFSLIYAPTGGVVAEISETVNVTVNALPEVASTTMQYSVDGGVNWAPAGGDLSTAFSLCMDPVTYADGWYHLDINTLAMVNTAVDLEEGVLNPFKLVSDPGTTFDDWWTAKFAEWNDVGMQTAMESILSGAEPMFYIKRVGTDYKLIDGFQYALDESEEILRLDSDYPVGDYTFNGTVTDVNGCVSGAFDVDLNITHNSTYAFSYNEPGSICATTGLTLPVTFGTAIEGGCGYDGVRFKITATGAGDVTMGAEDSNSNYYSFTNSGFWGPETGFNLPASYTATTNWDMIFSEPGLYSITFSLIYAPDGGVVAEISETVNVTVNALPEVTSATMRYSVDGGVNWAAAGGDLSTGFALCMDPVTYADGMYHLDIDMLTSSVALEEGVLNPFKLTSDPGTDFDAWWTAKMTGWPQTYVDAMQPILAGTSPMFYIKKVGLDYQLIDGFKYALDGTQAVLQLDSDYPVGDYTFDGMVTDVNGCVSGAFDVDLNITHNSTYAFSYNEPGSICATTGLTLPVTFGTAIEGGCGYDGVRFKIESSGPGIVTFGATDSNNNYHTFNDDGFWGPESGFDLPASYTATTNWDMTFSAPGTYNITFSLIYAPTGGVVAEISETVNVTVNALPVVDIIPASPVCNGTATGSVTMSPADGATYSYTLEPGGLTSGNLTGDHTFTGLTTGVYTWTMTDVNTTCSTSGTVEISETAAISLDGYVNYNNNANSPLDGVVVKLLEEGTGTEVASATTNGSGYYYFANVCPAIYNVVITTTKPVGSINATDAGQVNAWNVKEVGGIYPSIERVRFLAGDVSDDNYILSNDAFLIQRFFLNLYNPDYGFTKPWEFWMAGEKIDKQLKTLLDEEPPLINSVMQVEIPAGSSGETRDFLGMVSGDFDCSYTPTSSGGSLVMKYSRTPAGSVTLQKGEELLVNADETIDLPVKAVSAMQVGAISLIMDYPADMVQVENVFLKDNPDQNADFNIVDGMLVIAWNSVNPVSMEAGEAVLTVRLKMLADMNEGEPCYFELASTPLNELADGDMQVINNASLVMDGLKLKGSVTGVGITERSAEMLMTCYPNPFRDNAIIKYTLPEEGRVNLEVTGVLGNRIDILTNQQQTAGEYMMDLDGTNLITGVYQVTLRFKNQYGEELMKTVRMIKR